MMESCTSAGQTGGDGGSPTSLRPRPHLFPIPGHAPVGSDPRLHRRGSDDAVARVLAMHHREGPLRARQDQLAAAFAGAADSVVVTDHRGVITFVNPAFEARTGYRAAQVVGRRPRFLRAGGERPGCLARIGAALAERGLYRGTVAGRREDGSAFDEEIVVTPVTGVDGSTSGYLAIGRAPLARLAAEPAAGRDGLFDPVTEQPTLPLLRLRARPLLALARRRGDMAALLHVDVERLRAINEARGHGFGDELLRAVARRLGENVRECDLVCRARDDDFLVLLSEVADENAAARVAQRLVDVLTVPYRLDGEDVDLRVHVGLAMYPQDAVSLEDLMGDATAALERARTGGAPFEFHGPEQTLVSRERLSLEHQLGWAWNNDEFILHYQPILAVGTGRMVGAEALARGTVVGVEALARWAHPERGIISPAEFIPLAERTGRIVSLDRWAVATAARQAAAWVAHGWDGWVAVNLSARSLQDPDLPDYVGRVLRGHGLAWDRVVLEVTETTAMKDPAVTARVLRSLREAGALIAVDDFGTGHSSLAYLKHFPVDLLKLDRSFVAEVGQGTLDEELVEVMINLAHRIGARVVAEGVEREDQFAWLRDAGCDYIQGFLVGRPVPPDEVLPRLPQRA